MFTLNDGTRIAVKDDVNEEKQPYPETPSEAIPRRFDPGREFLHQEHERDCRHRGRPVGQRQSPRPKQWSFHAGAGLLG